MLREIIRALFPHYGTFTKIETSPAKPGEFDESWVARLEDALFLNHAEVAEFAETISSEKDRFAFLTRSVLEWVYRYAQGMDSPYEIVRSSRFVVMAPEGLAKELAVDCESIARQVDQFLLNVAAEPRPYPVAILAFRDEVSYYNYTAAFHDEETTEVALSGGTFFGGDRNHHIVLNSNFSAREIHLNPTLAHELSHCAMAHLELPAWIDEGITQNIEEAITGVPYEEVLTLRERPKLNREAWTPETIQYLWTGGAFFIPELQEYAYYFSRVLINLIKCELCQQPQEFADFVLQVDPADAGDAVFRAIFGQGLGVLIEEVLGGNAEDWQPKPESWNQDLSDPCN